MRWYYNTVYHLSLQTVYMVGMDRDEEYYMVCYEIQELSGICYVGLPLKQDEPPGYLYGNGCCVQRQHRTDPKYHGIFKFNSTGKKPQGR